MLVILQKEAVLVRFVVQISSPTGDPCHKWSTSKWSKKTKWLITISGASRFLSSSSTTKSSHLWSGIQHPTHRGFHLQPGKKILNKRNVTIEIYLYRNNICFWKRIGYCKNFKNFESKILRDIVTTFLTHEP